MVSYEEPSQEQVSNIRPSSRLYSSSSGTELIPQGVDALACIRGSLEDATVHKNAFKSFICTIDEIRGILGGCQKSLSKLSDNSDDQLSPASIICRIFSQYVNVLSSAVATTPEDPMRSMKRAFKEKVTGYDSEFHKKVKEMDSIKQALGKAEEAFHRTDSEMKKAHSKTTDPFSRKSSFSWTQSSSDRDKQFERMQKLSSELEKIASEAQSLFHELSSCHSTAYSRAGLILAEISSMRRRLNRKMESEIKQTVSKITCGLNTLPEAAIIPLVDHLKRSCPSVGDFGSLRLASPDVSFSLIAGPDRETIIKAMGSRPDFIEYRAVQSYMAKEAGELSFNRNELIHVLTKDPSGWWLGRNMSGHTGVLPSVLLAERPAGAALPLQQVPVTTLRPNLYQNRPSGTWNSFEGGSLHDSRDRFIVSQPPYSLVAVVQFKYVGEVVAVEPGEVVKICGPTDTEGFVQVKTESGQEGPVPIKILLIKQNDKSKPASHSFQNNENSIGIPSSYSINW